MLYSITQKCFPYSSEMGGGCEIVSGKLAGEAAVTPPVTYLGS